MSIIISLVNEKFATVRKTRTLSADVVVLLVRGMRETVGGVALRGPAPIQIAIVDYDAEISNPFPTFSHEVGHIFGMNLFTIWKPNKILLKGQLKS